MSDQEHAAEGREIDAQWDYHVENTMDDLQAADKHRRSVAPHMARSGLED